ncbi:MAG: EscU/YscU/HrcU family type III secretion system export apparatus switch protein [Spirochaetales bacterium]|nr:EscU/YscU/HrcU family type III secretion system export apparatus switch protein [Spirochaetales bacterium]
MKKAVAINYKEGSYAPKILSKGGGVFAEKILEKAEEYDIPIVEDGDLVEILFASEIFDYIPEDVFEITATILAYVYENEKK